MNREQYMKLLKKRLRHLPKDEFEKAVAYFEEYFNDAGGEREQEAIADLGMPDEAAAQIIQDIAIKNTAKPPQSVKNGMNAVWVGILALFAAPFTIPFFAAALAVGFVMVVLAVLTLLLLFLAGLLLVICGPVAFAGGFFVIGQSIPAALICFGRGIAATGAGLLLMQGMYLLIRRSLGWLVQIFGKMVEKGGK